MKISVGITDIGAECFPLVPPWVTSLRGEAPEDAAFLSGGALAVLHNLVMQAEVPHALWREHLALRAAEACVIFAGRSERAGELRDAVQFLNPGDQPGPAGEVYQSWRQAVARPVSVKVLRRALPATAPEQVTNGFNMTGLGAPIPRAASVLQTVLADTPRAHTTALILADAALARALGWSHVVPVLALGLKRGDLRKTDTDLCLACHCAVREAVAEGMRTAAELKRRAARLREVSPKLRAKGAEAAVELFLTREALAPTGLTSLRSDRAARRFCDRLVDLGAVRELTGRETFRLYGV